MPAPDRASLGAMLTRSATGPSAPQTARIVWALTARGGDHKALAVAAQITGGFEDASANVGKETFGATVARRDREISVQQSAFERVALI